ncbi:hypothetical protein CA262_15575 [Sphingobium sp. GW456-12-10-14-TSB1]|uniref:hypothetical protein n=1 Tax=Sphingobium sp. GW456-12-10-14-TSB1 TaxID=1987165 RepID=UPI000A3BCC94|nr:hypothetical protein [Sphingobium sp. GW456-12-10-14-TSB1]OUC56905.1 hypothetical protein CA262_15575 [Sphingobium sp. GW456-12-10-14-TSB1]
MSLEKFQLPPRGEPLVLAWPQDGRADGFLHFDDPAVWRSFVETLSIHPAIPQIVTAKFGRAQKLYLLGWLDFSLIKAGELAALIALELALMDRYGGAIPKSKRSFASLLQYMVTADGLTDAEIPMVVRCNGAAVGQLTGETRPTLAERRNLLAHGDPFDGLPAGGLLELVRDLINYAYRRYIAEARAQGIAS